MIVFAQDVVHVAGTVTVRWETNPEDPYHEMRHWDFLALHRAENPPGQKTVFPIV